MRIGEDENKKGFHGISSLVLVLILSIVCGIVALFVQYKYVLPIYDRIELPKPPEIVFYPDAKMSFGLINDTHTKTRRGGKYGYVLSDKYSEMFGKFLKTMRDDFGSDFLLTNGDVIDGTYQPVDEGMANLRLIKELYETSNIPSYWVIGNHDLRSVTRDQWKESLGIDYLDKTFEVDKYKIIIVDNQFNAGEEEVKKSSLSDEQKKWLENELASTRKIPVVFMHSPPFSVIEGKPCGVDIVEADSLHKLFARYHVAAVFAGHIEKKYHEKIDGVHYFVIPGFYRSGEYFRTFAEVEFKRRKPTVKLFYRDAQDNEKIETIE
jgi:Icc-related predicted phosphoesterase